MSAGETAGPGQGALVTRRAASAAGGLDPDTAPLREVGLLLGHDQARR